MSTLAMGTTADRGRTSSWPARRPLVGSLARLTLQSQSGMTMIELLVTVTLAAMLMALAVPSYRYVTNSNRATTEVNGLLADLQFARSEAIKESQPVTVCPSTNGTSCVANSSTWNTGWIVFSDQNNSHAVDTGDTILRVQKGFSVAGDSLTADNSVYFITYNREGFITGLPSGVGNGYFTITLHTTPQRNQWTRCLQVMALGSMTTQRQGQGSCN